MGSQSMPRLADKLAQEWARPLQSGEQSSDQNEVIMPIPQNSVDFASRDYSF